MFLLKKQRNELAQVLIQIGLDANEVTEFNGDETYRITHKSIKFQYALRQSKGTIHPYHIATAPGNIIPRDVFGYGYSWSEVIEGFGKWAALLKEEMELPDLWAEARANTKFLESDSTLSNDRFSPLEIKTLEDRVKMVEERIVALNLPAGAGEAISEIAREVPNDAKLLTKKKLSELLTGQLMSQGFKWALTTEHMQAIWQAFKSFTQLFLG